MQVLHTNLNTNQAHIRSGPVGCGSQASGRKMQVLHTNVNANQAHIRSGPVGCGLSESVRSGSVRSGAVQFSEGGVLQLGLIDEMCPTCNTNIRSDLDQSGLVRSRERSGPDPWIKPRWRTFPECFGFLGSLEQFHTLTLSSLKTFVFVAQLHSFDK